MPRKTTERLIHWNREHILKTAEKLFSEKGWEATTVDEISKAADCSKSTLYVYFKNKDEIHNSLILGYMRILLERVNACIRENKDFQACYHNICAVLVQLYEEHPFSFESIMGNISIDETERKESESLGQIYDVGEQINDRMLLLLERGEREQVLRENLRHLPAVYTLWASLTNVILLANQKEFYLLQRMGMVKAEFLDYSFRLLLCTIQRG